MNRQFWIVWQENGGTPTHKHETKESAIAEAKRLAKLSPDNNFFVLESIGAAKKLEVTYTNFQNNDYDPIPF